MESLGRVNEVQGRRERFKVHLLNRPVARQSIAHERNGNPICPTEASKRTVATRFDQGNQNVIRRRSPGDANG